MQSWAGKEGEQAQGMEEEAGGGPACDGNSWGSPWMPFPSQSSRPSGSGTQAQGLPVGPCLGWSPVETVKSWSPAEGVRAQLSHLLTAKPPGKGAALQRRGSLSDRPAPFFSPLLVPQGLPPQAPFMILIKCLQIIEFTNQ